MNERTKLILKLDNAIFLYKSALEMGDEVSLKYAEEAIELYLERLGWKEKVAA